MNPTKRSLPSLILVAFCAVFMMSIVPVVIKWINVNPATIGIVRLSIAVLGIAILLLFSSKKIKLSLNDLVWLALLGLVFSLHWYSYFLSIKMASASLAAIGVSTYGLHLLLLSSWLNKQRLVLSDLVAIVISLAGIYLVSPNINLEAIKWQGFLLAVLSGFLYACLPLINQKLSHLATNTRALGQFGFALCGFLLLLPQANFALTEVDWWGLLLLGVVSTLLGHTLWLKASTELPTNLTGVIYYAYVPIVILLSYFLLNEPMNWQKVVGSGLIILANILVIVLHKTNKTNAVEADGRLDNV